MKFISFVFLITAVFIKNALFFIYKLIHRFSYYIISTYTVRYIGAERIGFGRMLISDTLLMSFM